MVRSALPVSLPDGAFDRVIFSRSVDLLDEPDAILAEALRVGRQVTVGFVQPRLLEKPLGYLTQGRRTE